MATLCEVKRAIDSHTISIAKLEGGFGAVAPETQAVRDALLKLAEKQANQDSQLEHLWADFGKMLKIQPAAGGGGGQLARIQSQCLGTG